MKKIFSLLLMMILLSFLSACTQKEQTPVKGLNGFGIYNDFINNMSSGEVYKLHYSFHSWFEFCTSESTVIKFNEDQASKRQMLYRKRNPFVFWYFPSYDYYDGNAYYYKYKNEWYIDTFNKYNFAQQKDLAGIRDQFFIGDNVLTNNVYKHGSGYRLELIVQSLDKNTYYSLTGYTNEDFIFSKMKAQEYHLDDDTNQYKNIGTYFFRFTGVNKGKEIVRPKSLKINEIVNTPT